jgi:putative SOS response-associated peptidase YedK
MCNHKSLTKSIDYLSDYYGVSYAKLLPEIYGGPRYHENAFDFLPGPVLTAGKPNELQLFHWGLIPWWAKTEADGLRIRTGTVNCKSEEMYSDDKPSFRDAAKNNQRCLIPATSYQEWRWMDPKGKTKIPYNIRIKDQDVFSIAGLYSRWKNKNTDEYYYSYTVLTTVANPLMAKVHNNGLRMPVIIPQEYEKDWLNQALTKDDVLAFCEPFPDAKMEAYTISKLITSRKEDTNVPAVLDPASYPEIGD